MTAQASHHDLPNIPEPWSSLFGFARREHAYELRSDAIGFKLSDARLSDIEKRRVAQSARREAAIRYVTENGGRTAAQIAEHLGYVLDRTYRDLASLRSRGILISVTVDGQRVWRVAK
jgi:predicted HTH transcriptional regulator